MIREGHIGWRKWLMATLAGLFCFCHTAPVKAQLAIGGDFGYDMPFNHTDIMMEFSGGIAFFGPIDASVRLTYLGRLGERKVQVETDVPNFLLQYREGLNVLGIELEKRFRLSEFNETDHLGILIAGTAGMAFGSYDGTSARPETRFQPAIRLAPYLQTDVVQARLGYQYLPPPARTIFDHRIFLGIHFLLGDE